MTQQADAHKALCKNLQHTTSVNIGQKFVDKFLIQYKERSKEALKFFHLPKNTSENKNLQKSYLMAQRNAAQEIVKKFCLFLNFVKQSRLEARLIGVNDRKSVL